jgi:hypothetical protein
MRVSFVIIFIISISTGLKAQHPSVFEGIRTDTSYILINDFYVNLVKYSFREPNVNFLVIHDDEDTGVKAAFEYIQYSGGSVIDSQYGGVRNYNFNYGSQFYQIDPNKIYTEMGIQNGLAKYGMVDSAVASELLNASKVILNHYSAGKPSYIFTLHNNTDGSFGIASYLKGYELESTADSLYINFQMDPDDLILVTEPDLFTWLKHENVNVVLQSKTAPDDGSLSIYAMQNQIPYINVEVQHSHQYEHLRLIEIAIKALKACCPSAFVKAAGSSE